MEKAETRSRLVGRPRLWDDVEPVMKFQTVRSWVESRVGDGRKTALYHMAARHQISNPFLPENDKITPTIKLTTKAPVKRTE